MMHLLLALHTLFVVPGHLEFQPAAPVSCLIVTANADAGLALDPAGPWTILLPLDATRTLLAGPELATGVRVPLVTTTLCPVVAGAAGCIAVEVVYSCDAVAVQGSTWTSVKSLYAR